MRLISLLVLIAGLGLAGFGAYMLSQKFNQDRAELVNLRGQVARHVKLTDVVVSNKELRYGRALNADDVRIIKWPVNAVPENAFTSLEELLGGEGEKPRSITRVMEKGEAILTTKVTEFGQDAGVSTRLSKGMRAFTIRVDVASGVSGFLQPGDSVDILWSGRDATGPITRLILEKIKLIAIDQSADEDSNRPVVARTVTVEVSPITVAALAQAQATGKLSLSLRGIEDDSSAGAIEVDMGDIIGRVETIAPEKRVCTIKVRRGAEVIEMPSECPDDL